MKSNVGSVDKIVRYVIGIILLLLLFILKGNARYWGLLGLIPILTAAFGFCPLYKIFGFSTAKKEDKSEKKN
ncbi:YgaP family membrane protein [Thermoanaerobacterium thermosulfurigenes]|uniref:YgaP family membrane protein n=1 Tax=Thermoanaerobacterium thermosulfurigenes TaxID=33950 RepID=UPI003EF1BFCE